MQKHLVMTSISSISGMTEKEVSESPPLQPMSPYSWSLPSLSMSYPYRWFHASLGSKGAIDYSLHLPINHSGNVVLHSIENWSLMTKAEMLPRRWHESHLVLLVLSEDPTDRFFFILFLQVKWYSLWSHTMIIATVILPFMSQWVCWTLYSIFV